jgi:hypothetical protein
VIAALKAHQGQWYQYPLVGHWALDLTEQASAEAGSQPSNPAE